MIVRTLTLTAGIAGAAATAQFPEYSQQYLQRMAGKEEELTRFVAEFDADAAEQGMSREQALIDLAMGGRMAAARADTMVETIARQRHFEQVLAELRGASPFERARYAAAFTDPELARGTLSDFKPALPLTFEGLSFAAIGFALASLIIGLLAWIVRLPFRRRASA